MKSPSEVFWSGKNQSDQIAISAGEQALSYGELAAQMAEAAECIQSMLGDADTVKKLVIFKFDNSLQSIVYYLSLLSARHAMLVIDPAMQAPKISHLIAQFQPSAIWADDKLNALDLPNTQIAADVALLLPTSGSTGSAKMVALSYANLQNNAASICAYLPISDDDITLGTLPLFYSYGLSVLNSHLLVGAHFRLSQFTLMESGFWDQLTNDGITSIAGVPQWYSMLVRLGFTKRVFPTLRYFTQAGGKLPTRFAQQLADYATEHKLGFYIMYGQTEATARMAYLRPELVQQKPDSIGRAIPGGKLYLLNNYGKQIEQPNTEGELVYEGPNVMLGYVTKATDLNSLRPLCALATGDLAVQDEQGDLFIVGRKSRYAKVNGARISLDDVEQWLTQELAPKAIELVVLSDNQAIFIVCQDIDTVGAHTKGLADYLGININQIKVHAMTLLPSLASGKIDYVSIKKQIGIR